MSRNKTNYEDVIQICFTYLVLNKDDYNNIMVEMSRNKAKFLDVNYFGIPGFMFFGGMLKRYVRGQYKNNLQVFRMSCFFQCLHFMYIFINHTGSFLYKCVLLHVPKNCLFTYFDRSSRRYDRWFP